MDRCIRTPLLLVCAVLWLGLAAGEESIGASVEQDAEVRAAVGTPVTLRCRLRYEHKQGDMLFGKFYAESQGQNAGKSPETPKCWKDGRHRSCEIVLTSIIALNLSSSKYICEFQIPRPDRLVTLSGNGTTVQLYAEPASMSIQPQDLEEGKEAELRCDAPHFYPVSVTVSWLCGGRPAPVESVYSNSTTEANGTFSLKSWYKFTPMAEDNQTLCVCRLNHYLWTGEREARLKVNFGYSPGAIHMTSGSGSMAAGSLRLATGSLLNVTCHAGGRPRPEIQWFWGNMTRIASGGNLLMANITQEHEGLYWCVARNQYGQHNASMVLLIPRGNTGFLVLAASLIVTLLSVILCLATRKWRIGPKRGPLPESTSEGATGRDDVHRAPREDRDTTWLPQPDQDGGPVSEVLYTTVGFAMSRHPKATQAELEDPSSSVVIYSEIAPRNGRHLHTNGQVEALHSTYILAEWPSPCPSPASAASSRAASPSRGSKGPDMNS